MRVKSMALLKRTWLTCLSARPPPESAMKIDKLIERTRRAGEVFESPELVQIADECERLSVEIRLYREALQNIAELDHTKAATNCAAFNAVTYARAALIASAADKQPPKPPYGLCPRCGEPGVSRERRPNGYDKCRMGHEYPSREAYHMPVATKHKSECQACIGFDGEHTCEEWEKFQDFKKARAAESGRSET